VTAEKSGSYGTRHCFFFLCFHNDYANHLIFLCFHNDYANHLTVAAIPWGRLAKIREDIDNGSRSVQEGGTGMAEKWYDWCLERVEPYMT
jgi:hypothetical protein